MSNNLSISGLILGGIIGAIIYSILYFTGYLNKFIAADINSYYYEPLDITNYGPKDLDGKGRLFCPNEKNRAPVHESCAFFDKDQALKWCNENDPCDYVFGLTDEQLSAIQPDLQSIYFPYGSSSFEYNPRPDTNLNLMLYQKKGKLAQLTLEDIKKLSSNK